MAEKTQIGDDAGGGDGKIKEEMNKRSRGRPRKEEKNKEEAKQMRDYLKKGGCGFTVNFGRKKEVVRSPVRNKQNKEEKDKQGKEGEENGLTEGEKNDGGDRQQKAEATENSTAEAAGTSKAGASATGNSTENGEERQKEEAVRESSTVPTGGKGKDGNADAEEENTEESGREQTGISREELATACKLVKDLESRIDRIDEEKKEVDRELAEVKEQLRDQIEGGRDLKREMEKIKEGREVDRERLERLEKEIGKLKRDTEKSVTTENENRNVNQVGSESEKENVKEKECEQSERGEGGKGGDKSGRSKAEREYLKMMPDKLSEDELEWEMAERRCRKKNIFIRGIRTVGAKIKEEIRGIIKEKLDQAIYIKRTRAIGGGIVVELESRENKMDIMRKKGMLKGMNLWIEDDLTDREREIQKWLGMIVEEERSRGLEAQLGYQKLKIEGNWYEWREEEGRIVDVEEKFFRG